MDDERKPTIMNTNWKKFARDNLVGKTIVKVSHKPQTFYWDKKEYPEIFAIHLNDGQILVPSIDEEGNAPGVLFTNIGLGMYI